MFIANPIYDTVFKYMMSDTKVAKIFLSAIIEEKIVELDFASTERSLKPGAKRSDINRELEELVVCRFDFAAKIKTGSGEYKTVTIELQKAKYATDIMRFRRYLGVMYQDADNTSDKQRLKARQIYCIYLLNYDIGLSNSPVIKVDHIVSDQATGEELSNKNEFIQSLNHKSWIVQIRQLKENRRNDLENLLSIFDQDNITKDNHILNVNSENFSEEHKHIVRKLQEAYASSQVRDEMIMEDDYFKELEVKDDIIEEQKKKLVKNAKTIAEKDKTIAEKDKEIAELKRLSELKNKEK
ncbi:MAG TPA: hypothetical protein PKH15_02785 [Bacteroidales bacterium]|nr:MAG: hypothetical protein BWX59_01444 [Bacteroidetes bacterium ADurb.Bin028]HNY43604.1 hypothetical protein [Bacteroidales bacterium]